MKLESVDKLRGMSEPFPFSFTTTNDNTLVCHSVIFTSYEVRDGDAKIGLLSEDSDPRMAHLLKYVWSNFLKERRREMEDLLKRADSELSTKKLEFEAKKLALKQLKEESK
jgi:hypothetical protein